MTITYNPAEWLSLSAFVSALSASNWFIDSSHKSVKDQDGCMKFTLRKSKSES